MEEVQCMGECGEAVAILREWELKDEAVKWLITERSYVEVRERGTSSHFDDDADRDVDPYVLLVQVQRDFESVKRACSAGKEEVVVRRSLVEEAAGAVCELLASFSYLECPTTEKRSSNDEEEDLRYYYRAVDCTLRLPASDSSDTVDVQPVEGHRSGEAEPYWMTGICFAGEDSSDSSDTVDVQPVEGHLSEEDVQDWESYYRAVACTLGVPASDSSDTLDVQPVEGHLSAEYCTGILPQRFSDEDWMTGLKGGTRILLPASSRMFGSISDDDEQDWKSCCSLVMDTSKLPVNAAQLSISGPAGNGATVMQTPHVRFRLDAWARANEFHLDLKLKVVSLSVGVSKREFIATDTCLGFFPDWIRLSMEPCWEQQIMSEAIFENIPITEARSIYKSTQNTEVGVTFGMGAGPTLSAKSAWGKERTAPEDDKPDLIDYETEEGGVASVEWRICRWGNGKAYKSDKPPSPSLISSKKLPMLPFKGNTPPLKNFAAVSWRLPISMRNKELTFKLHLRFHMRLISWQTADKLWRFLMKPPIQHKIPIEREFGPFAFQLPAALVQTHDAAPPPPTA